MELGTGCGLVGLTAAAHGAQEAVLTDQVLHVATINADANFEGEDRRRIRLERLKWGDEEAATALGPPFDLILGSDIIYHAQDFDVLAETMASLAAVGTVAYLCTPDGSPRPWRPCRATPSPPPSSSLHSPSRWRR